MAAVASGCPTPLRGSAHLERAVLRPADGALVVWRDGEGVDVVYDSVGASTWEGSLRALRTRGMAVYYGNASGPIPEVDLSMLAQMGSLSVTRTTLKDHVRDADEIAWRSGELFDLWRDGKMKISISSIYPLSEAGRAHADLQKQRGRPLLPEEPPGPQK